MPTTFALRARVRWGLLSKRQRGAGIVGFRQDREGPRRGRPHRNRAFRPRRRHQCVVAGGAAATDRGRSQFRRRWRDLRGGARRQRKSLQRRFRSERPRGAFAGDDGSRCAAPPPETGAAPEPCLAGDGADHHRSDRRFLHRWRCRIGGRAGFSRDGEECSHARSGNRARHEYELAERAAHVASNGTGADQAGGDPRRSTHQRGGGL